MRLFLFNALPCPFCLSAAAGIVLFLAMSQSAAAQSAEKGSQEVKQVMDLLLVNPVAAKKGIDSLLKISHTWPERPRGNLYIFLGVYYGITNRPDSGIQVIQQAIPRLEGFPKDLAYGNRTMGNLYRIKSDHKKALLYYRKAVDGYRSLSDLEQEAITYGEIGSCYQLMQDYGLAARYLTKGIQGLEAAVKSNDPRLMVMKQKLVNNYMSSGNYPFSIKLLKEQVLPYLKESDDQLSYNISLLTYGQALHLADSLEKARAVIFSALKGLAPFKNKALDAFAYSLVGKVAISQNRSQEALDYYRRASDLALQSGANTAIVIVNEYLSLLQKQNRNDDALRLINQPELSSLLSTAGLHARLEFHRSAADILVAKDQKERAIYSLQLALRLQDSLNTDSLYKSALQIQGKYQEKVERQEQELRANQMKIQKRSLFIALLLALSVSIVSVYQWNIARLRGKLRKADQERIEQLAAKLRSEEALSQLREEELQSNRQKLISSAMEAANLYARIDGLKKRVVQNEPMHLEREISTLLTEQEYWKAFMEKFNLLNPWFMQNLRKSHPELTNSEAQFCALLKLNLSYKEIATILQINHRSVHMKKFRITEKLKAKGEAELEKIIQGIS